MKRILNEKGFGAKEIIIGLLVILALFAIMANFMTDKTTGDKGVRTMKIQAENFVKMVTVYKDKYTKDEDVYYLYELSNGEETEELVDPDKKSRGCDIYESSVNIKNPKHVVLRCGSYLIEGDYQKEYIVYEVGEWTTEKTTGQNDFLYNYKKSNDENEQLVLSEYVQKPEFIKLFNDKEGTSATTIEEIYKYAKEKKFYIDAGLFYRTKKLLKKY